MQEHIELNRQFRQFNESDGEDSQADFDWAFNHSDMTWDEVLNHNRVVILAEAGTGKTQEMKNQEKQLRNKKEATFFIRLEELLITRDVKSTLLPEIAEKLDDWLENDKLGWFFLDAVDEAKLQGLNAFETTLKIFRGCLKQALNRAHIYISSRPSDWWADNDLNTVKSILPSPKEITDREEDTDTDMENEESSVIVLKLAPLKRQQIKQYAIWKSTNNIELFMEELKRQDVMIFAKRPLDLNDLVSFWNEHNRISSLAEMMEFNIGNKLKEWNPGRESRQSLSLQKAMQGAMRLAATMTMTRKSSVILPDRPIDPQRALLSIRAGGALPDWKKTEITELLTLPLFDEATYGRAQFHHRSVREYLTAKWLYDLLESGLSRRKVEKLIFAHRYGHELIIPSMAPIAAWLALWDAKVRTHIIKIAPEILIKHGDPSQLPLEQRIGLLRRFAEMVEAQGRVESPFSHSSLHRLASPEFTPIVNEMFDHYHGNSTVELLLLGLIWQGGLKPCAHIAFDIAIQPGISEGHRGWAIRALNAAGGDKLKRYFVKNLMANAGKWGQHVAGISISDLFPSIITVNKLLVILRQLKIKKYSSTYYLDEALQGIMPLPLPIEYRKKLLHGLASLLKQEPYIGKRWCNVSRKFSWLLAHALTLATKIWKQVDPSDSQTKDCLFQIFEMAGQAERHPFPGYSHRSSVSVKEYLSTQPELRIELFWRAVRRVRKEKESKGEVMRDAWFALWRTPIQKYFQTDFYSFLNALTNYEHPDDRYVALSAAYFIWKQYGEATEELDLILSAVKNDAELEETLDRLLNPPPPSEEEMKLKRENEEFEKQQKREKRKRNRQRKKWIKRLQSNPNHLRAAENDNFSDLKTLAEEIRKKYGDRNHWGASQWSLLIPEFGQDIAKAARDGLIAFWRTYIPKLYSDGEKNLTNGLLTGLVGLAIEAKEVPNWASKLSPEEAYTTSCYAVWEMNGLPDWVNDLVQFHPAAFDKVMHRELEWEFLTPADVKLPHHMLSTLRYGPGEIGKRYLTFLFELLQREEPPHELILDDILTLLLTRKGLDIQTMASLALIRLRDTKEENRWLIWLAALMCVNAAAAMKKLREWVSDVESSEGTRRMVCFCNAMQNHHKIRFGNLYTDYRRLEILQDMIPLVHAYVAPKNDIHHDGIFTPGPRDDAQSFRSKLIEYLWNIPGHATYLTFLHLAGVLSSTYSQSRMKELAFDMAGRDAEWKAWEPQDVIDFVQTAEKTPSTPRELFDLACSRLDDLKLDLEEGDSSNAGLLRKANSETDVRKWFGNQLRQGALKKYVATQEEEMADRTKPDIRLHNPSVDSPVPIELKISDNWSCREHFDRLENQLVGQYMRDQRTSYGIFLLIWCGEKNFWRDSKTKKQVYYQDMCQALQKYVNHILATRPDLEEIVVIGIDLTKRG